MRFDKVGTVQSPREGVTGCRTDRIDGWRDKCEIGDKCSDTVNAHLHREGTDCHPLCGRVAVGQSGGVRVGSGDATGALVYSTSIP